LTSFWEWDNVPIVVEDKGKIMKKYLLNILVVFTYDGIWWNTVKACRATRTQALWCMICGNKGGRMEAQ
jgi:hypothetical protein